MTHESPTHQFLIGPGGSGKSTLGPYLAAATGSPFVDLDEAVCERVLPIPELVASQGYAGYCRANSSVAAEIVEESRGGLVIATSSGFLAHDDQPEVVAANLELIRRSGRSIFIVPALDLDEAAEVIADRQAGRWGSATRDHWLATTRRRLSIYREFADIEVVASGAPQAVGRSVLAALGIEPVQAHRRRAVVYAIGEPSASADLLVFTQQEHPDAGTQVPAGGIAEAEDPSDAAARELLEETGLVASTMSLLGRAEEIHPDGSMCDNWYFAATVDAREGGWDHRVAAGASDRGLVFQCSFLPLREAMRVVHPSQRTFLPELIEQHGAPSRARPQSGDGNDR